MTVGAPHSEFYGDCVASSSGAYKYFKDNVWQESASGKTCPILNPATDSEAFRVQGEF